MKLTVGVTLAVAVQGFWKASGVCGGGVSSSFVGRMALPLVNEQPENMLPGTPMGLSSPCQDWGTFLVGFRDLGKEIA